MIERIRIKYSKIEYEIVAFSHCSVLQLIQARTSLFDFAPLAVNFRARYG